MTSLREYAEIFGRYNRERRQYFSDAGDENAKKNLRTLRKISFFLLPILLITYCITPLIVTSWTITLSYILLLPVVLVFTVISTLYAKKAEVSSFWANFLCLAFYVVLFAFVIRFDVFEDPTAPASFMPLMLTVIPVVFIFRFCTIIPLMVIMEIIYVCSVYNIKEERIGQSDIFVSLIGLILGFLIAFTIVQLRIQDNNAKHEYQRRSLVDPVTGILNKFSFENSVREALKAREGDALYALLVLDIDNLKRMNDELGVMVGDMFLEDIAEYITHTFRGSDIIGRVGSDEFMIYVRDMKDEDWLTRRLSRIQREVKLLSNEHGNINMTVSIGVVIAKEEYMGFDAMYRLADDALYKAKTRGRGKYVVHNVQEGEDYIE